MPINNYFKITSTKSIIIFAVSLIYHKLKILHNSSGCRSNQRYLPYFQKLFNYYTIMRCSFTVYFTFYQVNDRMVHLIANTILVHITFSMSIYMYSDLSVQDQCTDLSANAWTFDQYEINKR